MSQPKEMIFGLIAGKSTMGKTTLAGTLPGKTLLLQVRKKERGGNSAAQKAEQLDRGAVVEVRALGRPDEFINAARDLVTDTEIDNVVVDGFSALTALVAEEPEIKALIEAKKGGSTFAGYDRIKAKMAEIHEAFADLTYSDTCDKPKNVFFTVAIEVNTDGDGQPRVDPIMKGKASYQDITRPSPTIITLVKRQNEDGTTERVMLTKDTGPYLGRVQDLLDDDNPGFMTPDLTQLLALIGGKKNGK